MSKFTSVFSGAIRHAALKLSVSAGLSALMLMATGTTAYAADPASSSGPTIVQPGQNPGNSHGITAPPQAGGKDADAVARGRYVAIAADCAACHTAPAHPNQAFAGGYALQTPFGKLLASNITSDKETGLGNWNEQEFDRAVRGGRGKSGEYLYPAMPYNDYVKINDQDMHDLWAYMKTVPAVSNKVVSNQLPFPFNIRLMMFGWDMLFFDKGPFKPVDGKSAEYNRGAYLVQSLGHCAACHTAKNFLGGDKGDAFLQGGDLAGYHAPEITSNAYVGIGGWSDAQVVQYLQTGSNDVAIASGPMAEAVTNSTQHMTPADLHAIAVYLKSLPASSAVRPVPLPRDNTQFSLGSHVYAANCAACHGANGKGISGIAPGFVNSPAIQAASTQSVLTTILVGGRGAVTENNPTGGAMPSFAWKMSDAQVAAVSTYIRNNWGNAAGAVTADEVAKARKAQGAVAQLPDGSAH